MEPSLKPPACTSTGLELHYIFQSHCRTILTRCDGHLTCLPHVLSCSGGQGARKKGRCSRVWTSAAPRPWPTMATMTYPAVLLSLSRPGFPFVLLAYVLPPPLLDLTTAVLALLRPCMCILPMAVPIRSLARPSDGWRSSLLHIGWDDIYTCSSVRGWPVYLVLKLHFCCVR